MRKGKGKKKQSLEALLSLLAIAVAVILVLVPQKTPAAVLFLLLLVWFALVLPTLHVATIYLRVGRIAGRTIGSALLTVAVILLGMFVWPSPHIEVRLDKFAVVPPIASGNLNVNVFTKNLSEQTIEARTYWVVGLHELPVSLDTQKQLEDQLHEELDRNKKSVSRQTYEVPVGQNLWFTMQGPIVSDKQVRDFQNGDLGVFFAGSVVYRQMPNGSLREMHYCSFNNGQKGVIFACTRFNN